MKNEKVVEKLEENNMEFLCITGVVDKLQVDLTDSIELLRNGGIQIWMLTRDKVGTATCITISKDWKEESKIIFNERTQNKKLNHIYTNSMKWMKQY